MAEPIPESVYEDAARALVRAEGVNDGYIASTIRDSPFRAAVESAYRAGLAARTAEVCDDRLIGPIGGANYFCERPLGHRGWHEEGHTRWREDARKQDDPPTGDGEEAG